MTRFLLFLTVYVGLLVGGTWVLRASAHEPPPATGAVPVATLW